MLISHPESWKILLSGSNIGCNELDVGAGSIAGSGVVGLPEQLVLRAESEVRGSTVDVTQGKAAIKRLGRSGAVGRRSVCESVVGKIEARGCLSRQAEINVVVARGSIRAERGLLDQCDIVRGAGGIAAKRERLLQDAVVEKPTDGSAAVGGANNSRLACADVEAGQVLSAEG